MQRPTTVLQWATILLVLWVGASDALDCYSCEFESEDVNANNNCTDPVANSAVAVTCSKDAYTCYKSVTKCTEATPKCGDKIGIHVYRSCSSSNEHLDSAYCCSSSYSSGKATVSSCHCTGDKCNGGESVLKSASLVVLATLAFVPYIASFIGTN